MTTQENAQAFVHPDARSTDDIRHKRIEFLRFGHGGAEETAVGYIWAIGPNVRGMRCFWVLEGPLDDAVRKPLAVAVVVASRRHRVGRSAWTIDGREVWLSKGGRYVDVGTAYTETNIRSATGYLTHQAANPPEPPRSIKVEPLDKATFAALSGDTVLPALLQ